MDRKKILVVDDEEGIRKLIEFVLQDDYVVYLAENGQEAINLLRGGQTIDLMVTDMVMPIMNGMRTIIEAKATIPDLKIVVISGHSEEIKKAHLVDLDMIFSKPFKPAVLKSAIDNVFSKAQ